MKLLAGVRHFDSFSDLDSWIDNCKTPKDARDKGFTVMVSKIADLKRTKKACGWEQQQINQKLLFYIACRKKDKIILVDKAGCKFSLAVQNIPLEDWISNITLLNLKTKERTQSYKIGLINKVYLESKKKELKISGGNVNETDFDCRDL